MPCRLPYHNGFDETTIVPCDPTAASAGRGDCTAKAARAGLQLRDNRSRSELDVLAALPRNRSLARY